MRFYFSTLVCCNKHLLCLYYPATITCVEIIQYLEDIAHANYFTLHSSGRHVVDKVGIGRNCLSLKQLSDFYITSSRTQHIRLWSFNICLVLLIVQAHREFDVAPIVSTPQRTPSSLRLMPSDVVLGLDVRHAQPNTLRSTRRRRIFQSTFWRSGENSGRLFSSACVIFTRFG